jgi:hypothetical protein
MVIKIFSGGQAGVDRAALNWAIINRVRHEGCCPKGRRAEDGRIPPYYQLTEVAGDAYSERTEGNVLESDGTLLITQGEALTEGSALTADLCRLHGKPLLHVKTCEPFRAGQLARFVEESQIFVLNVAGSRASNAIGIESFVYSVPNDSLELFLFPGKGDSAGGNTCSPSEVIEDRAEVKGDSPVHTTNVSGCEFLWPSSEP